MGTRVTRIIKAPRAKIYQALIDPALLVRWRAPDNMTAHIHHFEAGGSYRMSLTFRDPKNGPGGKTTADTDSFTGVFETLLPGEKVVERVRFETTDPAFAGEMRMTTTLTDVPGGTEVTVTAENLPPGIRAEDNEEGTRQSLASLARLVE